jgi:protein TonB
MIYKILLILSTLIAPVAFALNASDYPDISHKVDEAPVPVKTPPPQIPTELRNEPATVLVTVVIDESGNILAADVKKSTDERFNTVAVEGVKKWKFKPANLAGKPVKVMIGIPVKFAVD